jgi:predicted RNase H-like nuclease
MHASIFAPEEPRVLGSFIEVLDERPSFSVVALNAPVGYRTDLESGGRACDRDARGLLGRRASSVHTAPLRASAEKGVVSIDDRLDAVSAKLLPRYREVAAEMAPYRQRTVYEVHPELSFYQLNGDVPLRWSRSKKFDEGMGERRTLVEARMPGIERVLDVEIDGVSPAALLDVAACLWTARRISARIAIRLPTEPEWDEEGLRMEIVR